MRFLDAIFSRLFGRKKDVKALPSHEDGPVSEGPSAPLRQYDILLMPALPPDMPSEGSLGIMHVGAEPWIAPCPHPDAPRAFTFVVRGVRVTMNELALNRCAADMIKLLEATSLACAACGRTIVPTSKIAIAWVGAPRPFTHIECAESQELLCGFLSFGRLLTLHDCNPGFPPDTATYAQESMRLDLERRARRSAGQEVADEDAIDAEFEDAEDDDDPPAGNGGAGPN